MTYLIRIVVIIIIQRIAQRRIFSLGRRSQYTTTIVELHRFDVKQEIVATHGGYHQTEHAECGPYALRTR